MYEIIPGILEQSWEKIEEKLKIIRPFAKTVHIDLLDGKFAPNTTFADPAPFARYKEEFFLELHMMVEDPVAYVKPWAEAGFKRFIGQIEMMPDQERFVREVRSNNFANNSGQGCEVGLGIDLGSSIDDIGIDFNQLDFVFVMTVKAGFSNQAFLAEQLSIVRALRAKTDRPIEVDGGISEQTIVQAKEAGATRFVSTGFLFRSGNPKHQFQTLCKAIGVDVDIRNK
jgi:ribulose-phosphate 3-epimerase